MAETKITLDSIRSAIQQNNAGWTAGVTSVSELPREEQRLLLGVTPPPGELTVAQLVAMLDSQKGAPTVVEKAVGAPASFDNRNIGGANFITPVKNQGGCGSCVAFGTTATVEGTFRRQRNNASLAIDLSEAHLYYCHARSEGRTCANGWWPENAFNAYKAKGVADDPCYPYTAGDQNCTNLCADWANRVTKITSFKAFTSTTDMKNHIATKGPISACFVVYEDFYNYSSGIYRHVSGSDVGGHCVCIVGYDDASGCWICKNSWGTGWGESGFFRIAYGNSGIDTWSVHGVDAIEETSWLNGRKILGLWTIDQDRNAWIYLDGGIGWRRLAFDNDNIFLDFLVQAAAAKAGNRFVNVYQEQAVIKQIYVF